MTYPNPTPASINLYIRRQQGRDVATNTKGKGLTVIIPALNEEARIGPMLNEYATTYPHAEIIVVINGTTDKTEDVVKGIERSHKNVRHVVYAERIGKGGAVQEGFSIARGEFIGFSDADNSTPPPEFDKLINALADDTSLAGTIASRRLPNSFVPQVQPFLRPHAGVMFNKIVRLFFGIPFKDTQCGAKLFRRQPLLAILPHLRIKDWAFDIELLYEFHHAGQRILEVPITWYDKAGSKLQLFRTSWKMLKSAMRLRLIHSPLRFLTGQR